MGHLSPRELYEGTWREGSFTGNPERYAMEMDNCFHAGPTFGEHGGTLLS
jgi:hypothetical protein